MPLVFLSLRFQFDQYPIRPHQRSLEAINAYFETLDLDAYAQLLAERVPTLAYIVVHLSKMQQRDGYWKVRRVSEPEGVPAVTVERLWEGDGQKAIEGSPFAKKLCDREMIQICGDEPWLNS